MPKRDQKRRERSELKAVLSENLKILLGGKPDFAKLGKAAGIGRNTVIRAYKAENAATVDTIEALAEVMDIQPWLLLMRGGASSVRQVFTKPVPDERLGARWTRPDREPLLQSGHAKSSTRHQKIKAR